MTVGTHNPNLAWKLEPV